MKNVILREAIAKYNPEVFSEIELISLILGEKVARNIKERDIDTLSNLVKHSDKEIKELIGVTDITLSKIRALYELASRNINLEPISTVKSPKDIYNLSSDMQYLEQEVVRLYCLNTKNKVVKVLNVFKGSINTAIVDPKIIFKEALKYNSVSIIMCHNHPSGDTTPSKEDINITTRIVEGGQLLGIKLLDHVVIGPDGRYTSLKEKGII